MEITGRLVADATARAVSEGRKVTGFRLAINRRYLSQGERKEETSFVDCTYWRGEAIAPYLIKGMIVQLHGFMSAEPWVSRDGEPMASLKFRTDEIIMLSRTPKSNEKPAKARGKNKVQKSGPQFKQSNSKS